MGEGGFPWGEGRQWLQMALEQSISGHYSTACRLSKFRHQARGDRCWGKQDAKESHKDARLGATLWLWQPEECQRWREKSNLWTKKTTLFTDSVHEGFNWTLHVYAKRMESGCSSIRKHVNRPSVKKGADMRLKPIALRPKYWAHRPHFTVCGRAGFRKSYITSFLIQLSEGLDSSYISRWIDLCFQRSSPLGVCWLVERWQIGFHSLHEAAQWSRFDRVKRNSASTPSHLAFSFHAHMHAC